MKQPVRLLSILLAMILLFGAVSVGANGALVKHEVYYDSIDNAVLTPEQVANIINDMLDKEILPKIGKIEFSILGTLDLSSLDRAFRSIFDMYDGIYFPAMVGLGDIVKLNISALKKTESTPWQRSDGDLTILYQLLRFLSDNKSIVSKIAYGIDTANGFDRGPFGDSLDLGEVGDKLADIPAMIRGVLFDRLLLGSYAYPTQEDTAYYATAPATVYTEWDNLTAKPFTSIDTVLNTAVYGFLATPQDKYSVYEDGKMVRYWDTASVILPGLTTTQVDLSSNTVFGIIDNVIQLAYDTLATKPLNHDLKRVLMEATGVKFIEIQNPSRGLLSAFTAVEATGIKNYFVNAATFRYNENWYFSDCVTKGVDLNNNGVTDLDASGAEITQSVRRFFKADMSDVKPSFDLINWDYVFTDGAYDFATGLSAYGSLTGQLNHLLYVILDTILNDRAKAEITAFLDDGLAWFMDGDNTSISANLLRIAKYVICMCADDIFGGDPDYVDENGAVLPAFASDVKACSSLEDLLAYVSLPIFSKVMPEIILPGEFTSGLQIEQLAALVLREVLSSVTPALNFDSQIFASGTLALATGREFAVKTQSEWQDLLLGMGLNLAMTYLDNTTNINIDKTAAAAIYAANGWQGLFEEIVDWGVGYIGTGASGLLAGINPAALGSVRGTFNNNAFTILSTVLNKLFPFGFLCDCVDTNGNLDTGDLFWTVYNAVCDLDIHALLGLFGRSGLAGNIFSADNVITQLLSILNRIFGLVTDDTTILQSTSNLDTAFNQANLKLTISDLIDALYTRRMTILQNILPIAAAMNAKWGGEQDLGNPVISINNNVITNNGALNGASFTISNGAKGVWRSYVNTSGTRVQDNHYRYFITSVTCATTAGTVSGINLGFPNTLDYGQSMYVSYNISGVPAAGGVAVFTINYKILDENGTAMANNATFTTKKYTYLAYSGSAAPTQIKICEKETTANDKSVVWLFSPIYMSIERGVTSLPKVATFRFESTYGSGDCWGAINSCTPATQRGVTLNTQAQTTVTPGNSVYLQKFTVNETAYNAAGINSGDTISWQVQGQAWQKKPLIGNPVSSSGTQTLVLKFYSADDLAELKGLTDRECANARKQTEYKTGDVLADRLLVTAAQATEKHPQETNFTTTGVNEDGDTVTLVNGTTAWTNYVNALNNAVRAAYQPWNANSVYNQKACYEALRIAAIDVQVCKMTAAEIAAQPGAASNAPAVEALITSLDAIDDSIGGYKDYMLYRWNRLERWENKAHSLAEVYETANSDIGTTYFPYSKIDVGELSTLLEADSYKNYIEALLEPLAEEQITAATAAKDHAAAKYADDYDAIDIGQISNMLTKTSQRLLPREGGDVADYGYVKTYLNTEIACALAVYGNAAASTVYTEKSWNRYLNALAQAQVQAADGTENEKIFEAKYALQKAINSLIPIADGADYSGLEDAVASAQAVLGNLSLYANGTKDIGKVIAALGYVVDGVDLFPDAALNVVETPYAFKDQNKIDDAEAALRSALANLRYAGTTLESAKPEASTELQGIGNDSYFAYVPKNLVVDALHSYLLLVNSPADVTNIQPVLVAGGSTYAGTGTVITYYGDKTVGFNVISVPVVSYAVVVKGDISGDAVIDSADAMLADLALSAHRKLEGAFLKAALVDLATAADGAVTIEAFSEILNMAAGK